MKIKVLIAATLFVASAGCKTKVDPNAFEGGAAATPSVETTPSATTADDEAGADASTALAPLQTSTAAPHAVAPTGGSHATTKPAVDPPECVQARSACGGGLTVRPTKQCQDAKFACFNKGGHL